MNTLYHFTARRFLPRIKKQGLTLGRMLKTEFPVTFLDNYQWLTINSDFNQSWSHGTGRLPYKRNEIRLTLAIPESHKPNLKPWTQMKFLVPDVAEILSLYGDPENWFIYHGKVSPKWIKKITNNPTPGGE